MTLTRPRGETGEAAPRASCGALTHHSGDIDSLCLPVFNANTVEIDVRSLRGVAYKPNSVEALPSRGNAGKVVEALWFPAGQCDGQAPSARRVPAQGYAHVHSEPLVRGNVEQLLVPRAEFPCGALVRGRLAMQRMGLRRAWRSDSCDHGAAAVVAEALPGKGSLGKGCRESIKRANDGS